MAPIDYDGIYGESDGWLSEEEAAGAEMEGRVLGEQPRAEGTGDIADLDQQRAKQRR